MAAAVAAVWITGNLISGGSDEDETAADADRTSTTKANKIATPTVGPTSTTAWVIPGGPLLGEPSGLHLVMANDATTLIVDLDTGATTEITRLDGRVLGVADRRLVVVGDGVVAVWPPPYDGAAAATIATIPTLGAVEQAWVVSDRRLVWLVETPAPGIGQQTPVTAILVDLAGRTLAHFDLPDGFWPNGALDQGLVVSGPGGIYVMDSHGAANRISTGDVSAVADNRVLAFSCDERLHCGMETLDGRGRRVESGSFGGAVAAPDGRIANLVQPEPSGAPGRVLLDGATLLETAGTLADLEWSPDGRWLAVLASDGVHLIDTLGGRASIRLDLPPPGDGNGLLAFA